jgi:hypothetical protein
MKHIGIQSLVILSAFVLTTACTTNTETILKNEKGETRYCYLQLDRTANSNGVAAEYSRCINEAGAAGYRKTN